MSGHYFCEKHEDITFSPICCGQEARWVPDTVKTRAPVPDETARTLFAEMRDLVASTPDPFTNK